MAVADRDWPGHDARRHLPDDRRRRARRRAGRHSRLRAFRARERLRRALLRRVRIDGAGRRQRLHLRVRDAGRARRVGHRLGSHSGVRALARADRVVALGLLSAHALEHRHRVSGLGADRQRARGAPADRRFRQHRDAGDHRARCDRHPRIGERQRRARRAADRLDARLHRGGCARGSTRRTCSRSRRSVITACSRVPRSSSLPTSASTR